MLYLKNKPTFFINKNVKYYTVFRKLGQHDFEKKFPEST